MEGVSVPPAVSLPPTVSPPDEDFEGARARVTLAPPGSWVEVRAIEDPSAAYPLIEQWHEATEHAVYHRVVRRMENLQVIQEASQWRLNFDPATQTVVIHSIAIRRGEQVMEHANLAKLRFLRRERQMENLVLDGWWTAVQLLEDVRADDLLDVSYTVRTRPRYLEQRFSVYAEVPAFATVGQWHLGVRHRAGDGMKWKAGEESFAPEVTEAGGSVSWSWSARKLQAMEGETRVPQWYRPWRWLHVSSYESWAEIASELVKLWRRQPEYPDLAVLARQYLDASAPLPDAVRRAIEFVQDDIRYLSVNEDFGGQIPASPEVVLARRYGDCKDKALLLAELLKQMGIEAAPVLVNTRLEREVADFLPSPNIFNHAVVRYRMEGQTRWVDATASLQGGDVLSRACVPCGMGLPLEPETVELEKIDAGEGNYYKLDETWHLDTDSQQGILVVTGVAAGASADDLRRSFTTEGVEQVAKRREQFYRQHYPRISRIEDLQWVDDRAANRVAFAENYRVENVFARNSDPRRCIFGYSAHYIQSLLAVPAGTTQRKSPLAMPRRGAFEHFIELRSPTMGRGDAASVKKNGRVFDYQCQQQKNPGRWTWKYSIQIRGDVVAPEDYERHRRLLDEVWPSLGLGITLPPGKRSDLRRPAPLSEVLAGVQSSRDQRRMGSHIEDRSASVGIKPRGTPVRDAADGSIASTSGPGSRDASWPVLAPPNPSSSSASSTAPRAPSPDSPPRRKHRKKRGRNKQIRMRLIVAGVILLGIVLTFLLLYLAVKFNRGY